MLSGQQHQVGRGYFITSRAPPAAHDGDNHEMQRRDRQSLRDEHKAEEAFFNRQRNPDRTWPQEFSSFEDRCGIDQLVKFLAQTLAQEFARNLPELSRKLNTKLRETQDKLGRLPEMPQNPEHEVRKSLLKFSTDVQLRLRSKAFSAGWAKIAETFKIKILELKPKYRVMPEGLVLQKDNGAGTSDRDSVFSVNNSPSLSVKRQRPIDLTTDIGTPSAQRRRGDNGTVKTEESNANFLFNSPSVPAPASGRVPSKTLGQIRNLIRSEREAGKPGEVPYDVIEFLCMEGVKPWIGPLNKFVDDTMSHLRRELKASLDESFHQLKKRQVFRDAERHSRAWLDTHKARIIEQLHRNYKFETTKIYTMDDASFQRHRAHEAHMLKRNRHFYRWKHFMNDTSSEKIENWEMMTADGRRKEEERMQKEQNRLGDDPFEVELGVASHVRGYYLTAAMRFIDIIAMHITSGLFPDLDADIESHLEQKMGLMGGVAPEVFEQLMEEQKSTADKRMHLKAELERFDRAVAEIFDLQQTVMRASISNGGVSSQQNGQEHDESMDVDEEADIDDV